MGYMVLKLITIMPEAQMFFGAAEMILGAAADPIIIRMGSHTLPHYPGNYFQSLDEWFHFHHFHPFSFSVERSDVRIAF